MYWKNGPLSDKKKYEERLLQTHQIAIRVDLLDLNMDEITDVPDLSNYLLDGQVNVDIKSEVAGRTASITLLDPTIDYEIDGFAGSPGSPGNDGILFADRMIRIWYGVFVPELTSEYKWVFIPIFTGPITKLDRSGDTVVLEAAGKEVLAGPVFNTITIAANTNKIDAIRYILSLAGEAYFGNLGITPKKFKTQQSYTFSPDNDQTANPPNMWKEAKNIATSINKYLYYDGMGYVQARDLNENQAAFVFRDGDNGAVLTTPEYLFDMENIKNTVRIIGKVPEEATNNVAPAGNAIAEDSHPLSPASLGRMVNGVLVKRFIPVIIQNDLYTSAAACIAAAQTQLEKYLTENIEVTFESLVIPHLDPNDLVYLSTKNPAINMGFNIRTFTIPLNSAGTMSVGYISNKKITSTTKRAIRS